MARYRYIIPLLAATLALSACDCKKKTFANAGGERKAGVTVSEFGVTDSGEKIMLYTLDNGHGLRVAVMNYGATIVKLETPDRDGKMDDITLGFDTFEPYQTKSPYFGAIVGRFANRIAKGRFTLDGKEFQLAINDPPNSLHGGKVGFDKRVWKAEIIEQEMPAVKFSLVSPDGEEGYPGTLKVSVIYRAQNNGSSDVMSISYEAETDQATIVNLSNHAYFNLNGQGNDTILDHQLTLNASHYTPVDSTLIPTGEIAPVAGTPMDFRTPTAIGERLKQVGGKPIGYDHNFVLDEDIVGDIVGDIQLRPLVAEVYSPKSGRVMEIYTDQPGIQFYSGNFLDGTISGKGGKTYPQYSAIVLETQHFPDSPNQPNFPSTVLRPGEKFSSMTLYRFETDKK